MSFNVLLLFYTYFKTWRKPDLYLIEHLLRTRATHKLTDLRPDKVSHKIVFIYFFFFLNKCYNLEHYVLLSFCHAFNINQIRTVTNSVRNSHQLSTVTVLNFKHFRSNLFFISNSLMFFSWYRQKTYDKDQKRKKKCDNEIVPMLGSCWTRERSGNHCGVLF